MARTYRVCLTRNTIMQYGFGIKTISISIDQIQRIKLETSLGARRKSNSFWSSLFVVDRPLRRIVITPKGDKEGYVDVSLKHFAVDDIRTLMRRIHEQRPELVLPKGWD
ncbi:MAG: hypothetical protein JSR34_07005 [Proteobacteria bacterium]|nr:hypothetical protein [Pseudomonadota bacterium]